MERRTEPIKMLIAAVGGQGGGILTEWLVQAFMMDEFEVQAISLPGLSQRGGSTVYYLEAIAKANTNGKPVIFSQYPVPGDVDIILAQEFLELGRVLEQGYGSDKTAIISSTHRIYSTPEKMPVGTGLYSSDKLKKLATNFSSLFIGFDALELAKGNGLDELSINALLVGALAATDILPLAHGNYLKGIEQAGIAVKNNLRAFGIGLGHVKSGNHILPGSEIHNKWEEFKEKRAAKLDSKNRTGYYELLARVESDYPTRLREILAEALFRLIDYQDSRYAEKYLSEINIIHDMDKTMKCGYRVTEHFAKSLAMWMSYEDGIRVAELKIRSDRFKRISEEMKLRQDQLFQVVDFLKPDAEEIYGLLPHALVAPIIRLGESGFFQRLMPRGRQMSFGQKPVTTSFTGFVRLLLITKLKPMRPISYRYHKEHALIDKYKASVLKFLRVDYELGCLVSRSGAMIKGYGSVRRRTMDSFVRFVDNILTPLVEYEQNNRKGFSLTLEVVEESLELISKSTDGIEKAEKLTSDVLQGKAA